MPQLPSLALLTILLLASRGGSDPKKPEPAQAPREVRQYTIDQFLSTVSYSGPPRPPGPRGGYAYSFSPDSRKILVSSNKTGVFNAFAIPVDGSEPIQLTDSKVNTIEIVGYFPRDERFLYSSDQGGNELTHLYVQSPDGKTRDLTPGEKVKADFLGWASDERSFFFRANERDASVFDVFELTLDGYERKILYTNEGGYLPVGVSPDRRYVALAKSQATADADIYLQDRTTGKTALLTPDPPGSPATAYIANDFKTFSPDSAGLYYTTDQGSEFLSLMRYDVTTGKHEVVLRPDWDVFAAYFSRNGRYFAVTINNDAGTELRLFRDHPGDGRPERGCRILSPHLAPLPRRTDRKTPSRSPRSERSAGPQAGVGLDRGRGEKERGARGISRLRKRGSRLSPQGEPETCLRGRAGVPGQICEIPSRQRLTRWRSASGSAGIPAGLSSKRREHRLPGLHPENHICPRTPASI